MMHTTRWMKIVSVALLIALGLTASVTAVDAQGNTPDDAARGRIARALMGVLMEETQKATNLSRVDILKELRDGKTLADVINAHGGTVEAVKSDAKASATDRIKKAVADGKLTQAQADNMLAHLDEALDTLVNHQWPGTQQDPRIRLLQAAGVRLLVRETATQANITQRDMLPELRAGKTLAQIATEHGADPARIVSAAVKQATDQINKLVANGKLKREQADKLIAALPDGLTKLMNMPYPLGNRPGKRDGKSAPAATPVATPSL
jgi:polyhydroxyalkanoate synthesis regulator phasin